MKTWILRHWRAFLMLFFKLPERRQDEASPIAPALIPEASRPECSRLSRRKAQPLLEYGEFYFRDTILDQLGRYFVIINRMRRGDRQAYEFYKEAGAFILPESMDDTIDHDELHPWWRKQRPAFGMVMYGTNTSAKKVDQIEGWWTPFAIYFRKYVTSHAPIDVQPVNDGDVYVVTVYWDSLNGRKLKRNGGSPTEFAVAVQPDGQVIVLKILEDVGRTIRSKKNGDTFHVPCKQWCINQFFKQWAADHEIEVNTYLTTIFIGAANAHAAASNGMVQVRVRSARTIAVFSVNVLRMPYFFNDRNVAVKGKKIFHIVRTHSRTLGDGREVPIRTHFRGERSFNWNGYQVEISVPGWHHFNRYDYNVPGYDDRTVDPEEDGGWLVGGAIAAALRKKEKAGFGRWRARKA